MPKLAWLASIAGLAAACTPEVVITGELPDDRFENAKPWNGALVVAYDRDGVEYSSVRSNSAGRFRLRAPRGQTVFLEVGDEDHATASFTGTSGFQTRLEVNLEDSSNPSKPLPEIYGVPLEEMEEMRARFDGCPGLDDGALVIARVLANELRDELTGERPSLGAVSGTVLPIDGEPIEGCYLDEEGTAFDAEAELTGPSGLLAVPGVPPGLHTLILENHLGGGVTVQTVTSILVADAEVVPRFPFLMDTGLIP